MIARLLAVLLLCLLGFGVHAQPTGCTTTTCTGSPLSSGFLSVTGNQFVNGLGQAQRLACTEFKGAPNDGTMTAIRAAGFNCIRFDWRDAYLSGESPAGTAVTTVGPALNASPTPGTSNSGAIIQITSGAQVSVNGVTIGNTAGVVKLYYTANAADQFNGSNWFGPIIAGNGGAQVADPTIAAPTGTVALSTGCRSNADIAVCVANANAAGLKVVFSHRGNEGPTGACVTQQANGLWFDSGTDSGGSDGCISGAGSYTYAQFKADTVSLLTPFAANSTVVGYEMHHQPIVNGSFTGGGTTPPAGSFSTSGTNIIAPNGTTFQPRGLNIWSDDVGTSECSGDPGGQLDGSYANIAAFVPGTNFVRAYGPCLQHVNLSAGSPFVTAVNYLTAHGIVVLVEDTCCTGATPTDGALTSLEAFATAIATTFKGNSAVWFESGNEPSSGDSTNVAAEMVGVYNAIRAVDPTKIVVLNGTLNLSIPSSNFSSMTNAVWDQHYYNWETQFSSCGVQFSTNATCIQQQIQADKSMITAFWSGPYAIFEYGESTSGQGFNNGDTAGGGIMLRQLWSNATSGNIAGDAYFQWYSDGVPSAVNNDSIFASAPGAASGDFLGDTTSTCTATGTGTTSGCGAVEAAWIAAGQGPFSTSGGGGGGGGGGTVLTDGVNLSQAQVNTIVSNIQSTMLSEVPGGECFSGTCYPLTGLIGDSLVTTSVGTINTVSQALTDSVGNVWTLVPNQSCQTNPPDWWWAGLTLNGVPQICGYIMDMRLLNSGHVWIEEAKEGGWWDATANGSGCSPGCPSLIPFFQGDPGPGPNNVSSGGGGGSGLPPVSWGGGGPTDVLAACEDVGATVAAANSGVIEFCPGPLNNGSATGNLLNGATKPAAGGNGLSDLSNAVAHPVVGTGLAGKIAYSIDIYPSNLGGVSPDSPAATITPIWNSYFGSAMSSLPVMDMETGCSCDGTTGSLTDDNAMMTAWTAWANGQVSGGPTFTTSQQPISNVWLAWGNYPGVNPDGTQNSNGTLKVGQQTWWSTLLFGAVAPPPPTTAWNPSDLAGMTLSVNNTVATSSITGGEGVRSTASRATGANVCWAEQASGTITTDWATGLANSSANLSTSGGLGGDTTAIVIDPNSLGGNQSIYFNNVASNVAGATASANGDTIMMCANLTTDLFYATDAAMVAHFGAGSWNSSASCNPTVAACGISFSGMTGPFFILYNNDQSGSASTILTTSAQMPYAIPSGYVAWDTAAVAGSGRPMGVVIMGSNDNHRPAANDNAIRVAINRSYRQ